MTDENPFQEETKFFNTLMGLFQKCYEEGQVSYCAVDPDSKSQMVVIHGNHEYVKKQLKDITAYFGLKCNDG